MPRLKAWSALIPGLPLRAAAERFTAETGIEVDVHTGLPETWLGRLRSGEAADLVCCGAELLLDLYEAEGLILGATRRSPGRRSAALVAPKGSSAGIAGLADVVRSGVRVGIAVGGCTLGLWDEVAARAGRTESVRARISARANGCGALLGLLARREVDVAFGWDSFDRVPGFDIEVIRLGPNETVWRSTAVGVARASARPEEAGRLADFLVGPAGREIYRNWGWHVD